MDWNQSKDWVFVAVRLRSSKWNQILESSSLLMDYGLIFPSRRCVKCATWCVGSLCQTEGRPTSLNPGACSATRLACTLVASLPQREQRREEESRLPISIDGTVERDGGSRAAALVGGHGILPFLVFRSSSYPAPPRVAAALAVAVSRLERLERGRRIRSSMA